MCSVLVSSIPVIPGDVPNVMPDCTGPVLMRGSTTLRPLLATLITVLHLKRRGPEYTAGPAKQDHFRHVSEVQDAQSDS